MAGWARQTEGGRGGVQGWGGPHLGELVGDFREVGVAGRLLLERYHHEVLKELPLLPLEQLQLQRPVAGRTLQHRLDVDQALCVGWGQVTGQEADLILAPFRARLGAQPLWITSKHMSLV